MPQVRAGSAALTWVTQTWDINSRRTQTTQSRLAGRQILAQRFNAGNARFIDRESRHRGPREAPLARFVG